jgi:diaminopimelate decarboxylase
VQVLKRGSERHFCIVDAAMNDLVRPAMYNAWMGITPCTLRDGTPELWDVVGPICESGDWLGHERSLAVKEGDLIAVTSAGAYAMAMASNYNSRPRAAEVMVDGDAVHLIRERETVESLYASERLIG